MPAVETLTYEQVVAQAYYLVTHILDETWPPKAKRDLLIRVAPYFHQIAEAEREAYRRSNDETLTAYEQLVASRDESILNIAGGFVQWLSSRGQLDKRMEILVSIP